MEPAHDSELALLGRARLGAGELAALAGGRRVDAVAVEPLGQEVFNITTECLHRVRGLADGRPFAFVVKTCRSALNWPGIVQVPEHMRPELGRAIHWRAELEAYSGPLRGTLPEGLDMPRCYLVRELPGDYAALWLEEVADDPVPWDGVRFVRAAYLLGRFAGTPGAPEPPARPFRAFVEGVGRHVFIPHLLGPDVEEHPAIAAVADPDLVARLRAFARGIDGTLAELEALPTLRAHGDASPQNLFATGPTMTAIDWGAYSRQAVGFDLGQLLAGRANVGMLEGEELAALMPRVQDAYWRGLREEGARFDPDVVRRGHVLSMAIFSGLSALHPQELAAGDSPSLRSRLRHRAGMARALLDAVDALP